jgi:trans-2,3-dihydro-3-hydroxyanthranilate isomerase
MRRVDYFIVDVFTETALAGNPLAVFPDRTGLMDDELQRVARELNLSETVFVEDPGDETALRRLRIFTPRREIPLAGHPVVGTWFLLASRGLVDLDEVLHSGMASLEMTEEGIEKITFRHQLGVGVLPVTVYRKDGEVTSVAMDQVRPVFGEEIADVGPIAKALGLKADQIKRSGLPPQVVSTGLPVMIAPVAKMSDLQSIQINTTEFSKLTAGDECTGIYAFTRDVPREVALVRARGFFPEVGVAEDPATGSAAGCLGSYLARHEVILPMPSVAFQICQGVEIGRPSMIGVEITAEGPEITRVRVVGTAVMVIEAELLLPD